MARKCVIGDHVWIQPISTNKFVVPVGAEIISIEKTRLKVKEDDGEEAYVSHQQVLKTMHASSIEGVENMINLGDLQDYAILRNLEKRFYDRLIYTYTGTMLIAVNPYQVLPIYTNAFIKEYRNKRIGDLPPHIFAIGDSCYNDLREKHTNQCIVISGESGAGKTESTKLILQYLTAISGKHSWIEQQILEANPIMEAFGNAKTVRNDNSSRFGKYIDIGFNKTGNIEGAEIEQYLLEKSRLVYQNENERNYHIFYSMIAGLTKTEKKRFHLGEVSDFNYLNGGRSLTCEGRNEAVEFGGIRGAMKVLNFKEQEFCDIFQLLSVILHLGNVKFKGLNISNLDASDVSDKSLLNVISFLLGTDKQVLSQTFTKRSILAQGDMVVSHLNKEQAAEVRDAFAKALYGKLFLWIIEKINRVIRSTTNAVKNMVGVLDIFGFENFQINSFEQLCINYANESLQQFFVRHIFKIEQEYYTTEGINWKRIAFVDNQDVLDMIGIKPMNIMSLIDEESKFPKGTDFTMLSKLHTTHAGKGLYNKPKSDFNMAFGIRHFAGEVFYDIPGFLEKNRDSFSYDLLQLIKKSQNDYLKKLFEEDLSQDFANKRTITLSSQFRLSLDILMKNLNSCHPYFIRCIKPNESKQPKLFDKILCCRQLRYSGMMETARIRKVGYPVRFSYVDFVKRYYHLAKDVAPKTDFKVKTKAICSAIFTKGEDYQCGNTKIFLKEVEHFYLEEQRNKVLEKAVIVLQKAVKGWIYKRHFLKVKAAAITLQKHFRARGYRSHYLVLSLGYQRLQAKIRGRQLAYTYNKYRYTMVKLQASCKGYLIRQKHQFGKIYSVVKLKQSEQKELQTKGEKNYRRISESNMQKRLITLNREYPSHKDVILEEDSRSAAEIVDNEFNFLLNISTATVRKKNKDAMNKLKNDIDANVSNAGEDLSAYNFRKFAATYFVKNVNPRHSTKLLNEPLLDLPTPDDVLAAQTLWITVLRFMGDLPEPQFEEAKSSADNIMSQLTHTLSRSFTNRKEFKELLKEENYRANLDKATRHQLISMTLKRKNRLLEEVRLGLVEDTFASDNYKKWQNRKTSNLEKLHFIIGHGILRSELRDEIFCQICKQLTGNPSKTSHARGWILLSLSVGCFPPSEKFMNYLRAFIRGGPPGYAPYCEARLYRTFKNGARTQPPSLLELQATKNKEPIQLEVAFMDKRSKDIVVDSASTAEEVCLQIALALNLKDTFGFSLFITLHDKVISLGSDTDHIMDAISQCEQYAKEKRSSGAWSLFYRKEIFTPWHDPTEDSVATDLIYHQIIRGLKYGEYKCNVEGDVATLAAQQYYIKNGSHLDLRILHSQISDYLPSYIAKVQSVSDWEKKIAEAFNKSACVQYKYPAIKAKEDMVRYAKMVWPILFSRFFEAVQISGPNLPKKNMLIAVNWTGVFMIDEREKILLELSFMEISYARFEQESGKFTWKFILTTIRKEEYIFRCPEAANLSKLLICLLDGLKKRSRYCVVVQDYEHPSSAASFLTLKRGDLIVLENNSELLFASAWAFGECNKRKGNFPTEIVQILPTLHKPRSSMLSWFKKEKLEERTTEEHLSTSRGAKLYTLADFARVHFRLGKAIDQKQSLPSAVRRSSKEELWKYTNRPILQPLLKKLLVSEDTSEAACKAFGAILKYMGDLPSQEINTDYIFADALSNEPLRDEIYCQIMRQLTYNRLFESEERGWELMYLSTGLFTPNPSLMVELNKFLKSRNHSFVEPCLKRLLKTLKLGPRVHPPHVIEVEAIKRRRMEIYHKIYFPDNTDEAFEVDSSTKVGDLCSVIADKLGLRSKDGFSIFIKISDSVFSIPESSFFYDFLQELTSWVKQEKITWHNNAPVRAQYQVFFMKKLWFNSIHDRDVNADLIFHYHQELPKYLKGYHKSSKQDIIKLGALIYKAKFDDNFTQFSELNEFVPQNFLESQSLSEWKKQIQIEYYKIKLSAEEAKLKFLSIVSRYDTFGCTFFEVKQTNDATYPEVIVIAINEKGVSILHPQTKDVLGSFGYFELSNWSSGNTFFYLTIGNMMGATKLLFETSQGSIMDDLITLYIEYLRNKEQRPTS